MRKYWLLFGLLFLGVVGLGGCQVKLRNLSYAEQAPSGIIPATSGNGAQVASQSAPALTAPAPETATAEAAAPEAPYAPAVPGLSLHTLTPEGTLPSATASTSPTPAVRLPAEQWKTWPALPQIPAGVREVYQRGLAQANDPRAFSILGDCQSQPDVFLGAYDRDPAAVRALPAPLQETVANFAGSFYRYSPTVKDGTTEGALLWVQWNDNKEKKCKFGETPLDCELRVHRPSIVFIHVGTHWETRNRLYLQKILDNLLDYGAAPILVTKADNREKDERVNHNLAALAEERGLPLWNFWSMVQHLPENGLKRGSDMYLSQEAVPIHQLGALQALDSVWRAVR